MTLTSLFNICCKLLALVRWDYWPQVSTVTGSGQCSRDTEEEEDHSFLQTFLDTGHGLDMARDLCNYNYNIDTPSEIIVLITEDDVNKTGL